MAEADQCPRLALGTVQFGLPYGLRHHGVPVARNEVTAILQLAWDSGIDMLDTAAAYGEADRAIGELRPPQSKFAVVSKTAPLGGEADVAGVIDRVRAGLERMDIPSLHGLMVHQASDLLGPHGRELYAALSQLRDQRLIERLGVSVYTPDMLARILDTYAIDIVQLPLNVFDQRFVRSGALARLKASRIEVHVRSVFLQGVLLSDAGQLPPHLAHAADHVARYHAACERAGLSRVESAFYFVKNCVGVDRIVIGVDSAAQLHDNIAARNEVSRKAIAFDFAAYASDDATLIDPRNWATRH